MDLLLTLLDRKNICLRSLLRISQAFHAECSAGDIKNLEQFQSQRQNLFRVMRNLDHEIDMQAAQLAPLDGQTRLLATRLLEEKDLILNSVLRIDAQIINNINDIKSETIQKLQSLQGQKRTLSAYKSPLSQIESAEGKNRLDNEA